LVDGEIVGVYAAKLIGPKEEEISSKRGIVGEEKIAGLP
jgi:hypothetical protein